MFFSETFIFINFILLCIFISYVCGVVGYFIRPKSLTSFFIGFFLDVIGWVILAIMRIGDKIEENSDKYDSKLGDKNAEKHGYGFIKYMGLVLAGLSILIWVCQWLNCSITNYQLNQDQKRKNEQAKIDQEQQTLDIIKHEQLSRDRILALEEKRRQDDVIRFATEQARKEKEHQEYLKREEERQEAQQRRMKMLEKERQVALEKEQAEKEKQEDIAKQLKYKSEQEALKLSLEMDRKDLMTRKEILSTCESLTKQFNDTGENITIKNIPIYSQIYDEMNVNVAKVNTIQEKNQHLVNDDKIFKDFQQLIPKVREYRDKAYGKKWALDRYADEQELNKLKADERWAEYTRKKAELDARRKLEQQSTTPTPVRTIKMGTGRIN